jgi:hypothetical protein
VVAGAVLAGWAGRYIRQQHVVCLAVWECLPCRQGPVPAGLQRQQSRAIPEMGH